MTLTPEQLQKFKDASAEKKRGYTEYATQFLAEYRLDPNHSPETARKIETAIMNFDVDPQRLITLLTT